jgi:DNA-binding phage protein
LSCLPQLKPLRISAGNRVYLRRESRIVMLKGKSMTDENRRDFIAKINEHIKAVCGLYTRVARKLGLDRSFVSRVARGERKSPEVEAALIAEFRQAETDNPVAS